MYSPETQRETERRKARNHPPGWMAMPQSLLLHSPLGILGMHAHAPGVSFKPPGPGCKPQLTTWEFSDIAIMLIAGPIKIFLNKNTLQGPAVVWWVRHWTSILLTMV